MKLSFPELLQPKTKLPQMAVSFLLLLLGPTHPDWQKLHSRGGTGAGAGWAGPGRSGQVVRLYLSPRPQNSEAIPWAQPDGDNQLVPTDELCLFWPPAPFPTGDHMSCSDRKP